MQAEKLRIHQGTARRFLQPLLTWDAALVLAVLLVAVAGTALIDGAGTPRFWRFVTLDVIPIALIALPLTLIVITGEIDLSVASVLGLSCAVIGELYSSGVRSLPLLIAVAVVLGGLLGAVNGLFVTGFGLPSLAVTIGTLALYRGVAHVILGDRAISGYPLDWTRDAVAPIPGTVIPWFVLVVAGLGIIAAVVLHATPIGRGLYAIGNNAEAAAFAGIRVKRVKFWLFTATGATAALAGVYWTLRYASARADNGSGLELSVVAAVLLGGVSIFGGRGRLLGVVAGVVLLVVVRNSLQLAYVPENTLTIVTGTLLVLSVVAPHVVRILKGQST